MTLFCFLWIPLFYLFRRSTQEGAGSGGIWALLLGSAVALVQFFLGSLIDPGGFGLSRWISAWVDIIALPVIIPFLIYLIFVVFKISPGSVDFANFALLWLTPGAAIRAVSWSSGNEPASLVLVPLIWTALAVGGAFFIDRLMKVARWYLKIPLALGLLALPFLGATVWWAFNVQRLPLGFLLFGFCMVPLLVSLVVSWQKSA